MTINMWIATCAWLFLVLGYFCRFRTKLHVPLVLTGICMDILLVLYLQLTRGAVQKALSFSLAVLKQIHIGFSTSALVLYFPVLILGFKLLRKQPGPLTKQRHIRIASLAIILRTLGFLFMFSMLKG